MINIIKHYTIIVFLSISAMDATPSVCRYCCKAFGRQSTLRQHEMRHRGEGPYTCTECDVVCFSKGAHTRHIISHSQIRSFKCKMCQNAFASQSELERHERREAKDFKYKCTVCGNKFEEKEQLADHMGKHKGGERASMQNLQQGLSISIKYEPPSEDP